MPSKSAAQHRLMAAAANNPKFAKKVGVPQSVGAEFMKADKGRSFSTAAKVNRPNTAHGKMDMPYHSVQSKSKGGEMKKQAGKTKKYAMGGMSNAGGASRGLDRAAAMSGRAMPTTGRPMGLKNGGGVFRRSADGIAQRGKTKGKMLRKGGSC